ncbi:M20 family metallopeptidase [Candidatus Absconditicoccus praedator]|uniref:M20 family metallopeptidase n=1 Tax=Candidatus Absconditicoccus praedator TaxID=2735562 RepID=UPI001E3129FD|nr:M20/M25/M40 family metallo-hydrolase [Candidatus Absconditicoccus praedator]UFX82798.1 M20/M25/M40 family metallo-hydrolase [Candidatus Absconditicoccus praedator]
MYKQKNLEKIVYDLIKIPSESDDIAKLHEIVDYVQSCFDGFSNVFIKRLEYGGKPSIVVSNFDGFWVDVVFSGHLDVVSATEENQYEPYQKDGKLYARGSGDMKASCAVIIKIMQDIFQKNYKKKKVSAILTTDEEVGGKDGVGRLVEEGYGGDVVLLPDGGQSNEIVLAEKGVFIFGLKSYGKSSHSSRPWLGDNAIDKTINFYNILKNYFEKPSKIYGKGNWGTTINLNTINGGSAMNRIPDFVEATFDVRFTEDYKFSVIYEKIKEFAEKFDCTITSKAFGEVLYANESDEDVQKYYDIAKNVLGTDEIYFVREHGASDGRFFAQKGSKIILHRPSCGNLHVKKEWVSIAGIEGLYEIYSDFLEL